MTRSTLGSHLGHSDECEDGVVPGFEGPAASPGMIAESNQRLHWGVSTGESRQGPEVPLSVVLLTGGAAHRALR
jgi:hypothetical protein